MTDSSHRTIVCSVLFLDIVEYSKRSVTEQMEQKQAFNALLERALENVAVSDRIVLDTGDGAAVSFLGNPEEALYVGMALRNAILDDASHLAVRSGVNLGPVRLIKDLNGQLNIIGDGINVAQRVMSFAGAGQLLVSRSYYEVVSRLDPQFEKLFQYEGARTDKHVREHEVYAVGSGKVSRPEPTSEPDTIPLNTPAPQPVRPSTQTRPFNKRLGIALPAVMAVIIGGGVAVRVQRDSAAAPVPPPPVQAKKASTPAQKAAPRQVAIADKAAKIDKKEAAKKAAEAPAGTAAATLAIVPWGEIYVNGKPRGVTPPLRILELPPGSHKVEVRNGNLPPHVEQVTVRAGDKLTIRHRFN
jgi:class 3 adenylate cyclase